jgi:peptidoglycan/xylan/chitin deacetylase (PgdA/CDA1 family)
MSNKRDKRDISEILSPYLITVIVVVGAMVFFMLIWMIIGGGYRRELNFAQSGNTQTAASDIRDLPSAVKSIEPETEDGSGRAGIQLLTDEMKAVSTLSGRYSNDIGSWYSPKEGYCYYNGWVTLDGERYHFDAAGYIDTGWTAIGGSGYYFDESGKYDRNKDGTMLVALTFDDGPSPYTSDVLDLLEQYDSRATFLMLGTEVEKYGDVIPRMAEMGNTIGNHSYSHPQMLDLSAEQVAGEFAKTDEALSKYGLTSSVVRFPYGDYTKELLAAVNKPQIYWDVDSLDWDSRNASAIVNEIYSELQPGCIILMHDIYPETVEALKLLIPSLKEDGYELVNIQDLAASRGYELKNGVTYKGFKQSNIDEGRVTDE